MVASSGVPKVEVGIGRNPCWFGRHRCGGACGYRLTFLEGVGATFLSPHSVPGETLGSSVVIVASLFGGADWYRCFGGSELGGHSSVGAAATRLLRFVDLPLLAFVSLVFFLLFFWA